MNEQNVNTAHIQASLGFSRCRWTRLGEGLRVHFPDSSSNTNCGGHGHHLGASRGAAGLNTGVVLKGHIADAARAQGQRAEGGPRWAKGRRGRGGKPSASREGWRLHTLGSRSAKGSGEGVTQRAETSARVGTDNEARRQSQLWAGRDGPDPVGTVSEN